MAVSETSWFKTGLPKDGMIVPPTERQIFFLQRHMAQVLDLLSPPLRVNAELMGFEEWIQTIDRYEASDFISKIKEGAVAQSVIERPVPKQVGPKAETPWYTTGVLPTGRDDA